MEAVPLGRSTPADRTVDRALRSWNPSRVRGCRDHCQPAVRDPPVPADPGFPPRPIRADRPGRHDGRDERAGRRPGRCAARRGDGRGGARAERDPLHGGHPDRRRVHAAEPQGGRSLPGDLRRHRLSAPHPGQRLPEPRAGFPARHAAHPAGRAAGGAPGDRREGRGAERWAQRRRHIHPSDQGRPDSDRNSRLDMQPTRQAVRLAELQVTGEKDEVLNAGRTGAATFIDPTKVALIPSIKRSTRDLTRLDPRSDGNFSFAGRNWLYNNISLDGSYFNNSFGLDDPAPGGQTNAEPVPYDAVEQVQVSVAPFDVRQGGFTGANVNTVTKSGTNQFRGTAYGFYRNDALEGNSVRGSPVVANPSLKYVQSGFALSGPLKRDKAFFYVNAEL